MTERMILVRKCLILLLAAALALGSCPALGEAGGLYISDFSSDADGWYARSAGGASISILPEGALRITGRDASWNSPGRDFDLIPGGNYALSVEVRQDQADSAGFMISVAHSADGVKSYENLARGTAKRGEWTRLSGSYVAGAYDRFVLYVETVDAPDLDFDIRDFRLDAPDGLPERKPTPEPMVIEAVDALPALREIYAGQFDVGICVPKQLVSHADAMELVKSQFSIVTPENELKPDAVLDIGMSHVLARKDETAVAIHLDAAKPLLDFARDNGIKVHGHVLVWHSQTPDAFFHEGYNTGAPLVSREVMLGRLENYIRLIMEALEKDYPGVVVSWDVVNEAVDDNTGKLRGSPWLTVVGEDYVARAFELARKYAPKGTLLYYNDYNTAYFGKQNGIVHLLESLIPEGNIDGYGFQMHHGLTSPTLRQITDSVERIAALGIRLRVSEMDVTVGGSDESSFTRQAQLYGAILRLVRAHADQFEAVQFWGLSDNLSWRASQYPLLFDGNRNPKPAFWAVADPDSVE